MCATVHERIRHAECLWTSRLKKAWETAFRTGLDDDQNQSGLFELSFFQSSLKVRKKLQRLFHTLLCFATLLGGAFEVLGSPRDYEVDRERSKVNFSFAVLGLPLIEATFNDFKGKIVYDLTEKTGNAQFFIDLRSVETGITAVNERMQEPELLSTERFPIATFQSSRLQFKQERLIRIEGDLTIKGTTRNVEFEVQSFTTLSADDASLETISAIATALILRSDFGAGKYAPFVGNQVRIQINLVAASP